MMLTAFVVAGVGLAVGSFLNVCIDRLPAGQSLFRPRSHCPRCGTTLAVRDLVPVLSFLLLRGRCRYCSARIPGRVPIVEAATGLLFALIWVLYGPTVELPAAAFVDSVLVLALGLAFEHRASRRERPTAPSDIGGEG